MSPDFVRNKCRCHQVGSWIKKYRFQGRSQGLWNKICKLSAREGYLWRLKESCQYRSGLKTESLGPPIFVQTENTVSKEESEERVAV